MNEKVHCKFSTPCLDLALPFSQIYSVALWTRQCNRLLLRVAFWMQGFASKTGGERTIVDLCWRQWYSFIPSGAQPTRNLPSNNLCLKGLFFIMLSALGLKRSFAYLAIVLLSSVTFGSSGHRIWDSHFKVRHESRQGNFREEFLFCEFEKRLDNGHQLSW